MEKCIYCLKDKPENEFNTEHVISRFISTFGANTLVLNNFEVCESCNKKFCNEFENSLALDSIIAKHLYENGLKKSTNTERIIGKTKLQNKFISDDGYEKYYTLFPYNGQKNNLLRVQEPNILVGYENNKKITFSNNNFTDESILKVIDEALKNEIEYGAIQSVIIEVNSANLYEKIALLVSENIPKLKKVYRQERDTNVKYLNVLETTKINLDEKEFRLIAKHCFNLIAYQFGKNMVLRPEFNVIRDFINGDIPYVKHDVLKDSVFDDLLVKHDIHSDEIIYKKFSEKNYSDFLIINFEFDEIEDSDTNYRLWANYQLFDELHFKIEMSTLTNAYEFIELQTLTLFDCKEKKIFRFDYDYLRINQYLKIGN